MAPRLPSLCPIPETTDLLDRCMLLVLDLYILILGLQICFIQQAEILSVYH